MQTDEEEAEPGKARVSWTMLVDRKQVGSLDAYSKRYEERRRRYLDELRSHPETIGPEKFSMRLLTEKKT